MRYEGWVIGMRDCSSPPRARIAQIHCRYKWSASSNMRSMLIWLLGQSGRHSSGPKKKLPIPESYFHETRGWLDRKGNPCNFIPDTSSFMTSSGGMSQYTILIQNLYKLRSAHLLKTEESALSRRIWWLMLCPRILPTPHLVKILYSAKPTVFEHSDTSF